MAAKPGPKTAQKMALKQPRKEST